jgi:hypothetical protein
LSKDVLCKIERTRVIEVLDDIAKSATPIQANRCQSVISAVFSWALDIDAGKTTSRPALRARKRGAEVPRYQVMDDQQLRQFWQQLGTLAHHVERMIKLLLLLLCVRSLPSCGVRIGLRRYLRHSNGVMLQCAEVSRSSPPPLIG